MTSRSETPALWIAKQHGHSLETTLRVNTAWVDGAIDADIGELERAMSTRPVPRVTGSVGVPKQRVYG